MIVFIPSVPAIDTTEGASGTVRTPWLMFNSHLSVSFDSDVVNHTVFQPDVPVSIPFEIQYKDDIPQLILSNPLLRFFYLRVIILPTIRATLTITNPPSWANIYFSTDSLLFPVSNVNQTFNLNLIISLNIGAPAQPFTLRIKANTSNIDRIARAETYSFLTFTPGYFPIVQLVVGQGLQTPPNQLTFIPMYAGNAGNDVTKLTAEITNSNELMNWTVYITPEAYLPCDQRRVNLTFFCIPPTDFLGYQTIILKIIATQWSNPESPQTQQYVQTTVHYP
jgi:hypothetical protein